MADKRPPVFKKDFQTDAWDRVRARIEFDIERLRDQLEADSDELTTSRLRGRLRQLRELLAWETMPANARRPGDRLTTDDLADATAARTVETPDDPED